MKIGAQRSSGTALSRPAAPVTVAAAPKNPGQVKRASTLPGAKWRSRICSV